MPRPFRAVPAVAGFILLLALAACASPAPSSSDAADPDPSDPPASVDASSEPESGEGDPEPGTDLTACEILTAADVESALGLDPGTIEQTESIATPNVLSPGNSQCEYSGDDWGGVSVILTPEDGVNLYDAARGSYDDASDLVIVGTDGAFWSTSTDRAFVWKGNVATMIQIGFLVEAGADRPAIAEELLTAIASKVD